MHKILALHIKQTFFIFKGTIISLHHAYYAALFITKFRTRPSNDSGR